ncbi:MAG: hypothetical protein J0I06_27400 [Planctomycetes bacterium]|nr:hypothetical protein [Planctomycetota bacterium]
MAAKKKDEHPVAPLLRVAPLGELKVYTVTEDELDQLGRGSPGSVYLNFGLALVPVAVAFLITIASTDIPSLEGKIFFIAGCILFFLVGTLCLVLARVHHVSNRTLVEKIKSRMPPPDPVAPSGLEGPAPPPPSPTS